MRAGEKIAPYVSGGEQLRTFWPLFIFISVFALWFAYDGWLNANPEIVRHQLFNRVMTGIMALPLLLAAWLVFGEDRDRRAVPAPSSELGSSGTRWNWGAFLLTPFWGVGNRVYWTLLSFVPVLGVAVSILAGVSGERYARKSLPWRSEEEFLREQRAWNWVALGLAAYVIFLGAGFSLLVLAE